MLCVAPIMAIGAGVVVEPLSTEISQEKYKEKDAQKIRDFIQAQNLSRLLIRIGLNDIENEFDREDGNRRIQQIASKYQRVLDTLKGVDYSIKEEIDELGTAVLDVQIDGFEILAHNPYVADISSPTLYQHYDAMSPTQVLKMKFRQPKIPKSLPPPSLSRYEVMEEWGQKVISKLGAGNQFVTVTVVLSIPEQNREPKQVKNTKKKVIKKFIDGLSGTNFALKGSALSDPPTVILNIDETTIDNIISNQDVVNALVL